MEMVQSAEEVQHPIVREALKVVQVRSPHLEITSMSDIPAGSGLGSSGSFTTALLRALHTMNMAFVTPQELAEQACHIEIDLLGRAHRQAGPVHRILRRHHKFQVPAERRCRGGSAQPGTGNSPQPGRQFDAILHRVYPVGIGYPEGSGQS
jgi:hypothetical protein